MKKFLLAGAAALLSLVIVSCDIIPGSADNGTEPVQYTADGRQLVSVKLNAGGGNRALTDAMAKAGVDYYEAVFKNGTNYYRTAWHRGEEGRILLPVGTYGTAAEAMLFAGKASDKTLLATGTLDTNKVVSSTTASLTFLVAALTASVTDKNPATPDTTTSSFLITGPTPTSTGSIPKTFIKNEGRAVPIFLIPEGVAVEAIYTIGGLDDTGNAIFIDASLSPLVSVSVTPEKNPEDKVVSISVTANIVPPTTPPPPTGFVGTEGELNIKIDSVTLPVTTPQKEGGISSIQIELPVTAIAAGSDTNGIIWYIRGGLANYEMDFGGDAYSQGGSILLGIGTVNSIDLTITGP